MSDISGFKNLFLTRVFLSFGSLCFIAYRVRRERSKGLRFGTIRLSFFPLSLATTPLRFTQSRPLGRPWLESVAGRKGSTTDLP